jgi:hypothetical protein
MQDSSWPIWALLRTVLGVRLVALCTEAPAHAHLTVNFGSRVVMRSWLYSRSTGDFR